MATELIVNNISFQYPTSGDEPGWGGPATDWATEVTNVLSNVFGADDILQTSFSIANNQTSAVDVIGLQFNAGTVRSAVITYNLYRTSDSTPSGQAETGQIFLIYDNVAGFTLSQGNMAGNAGVNFSITAAGQFQYTSTDIGSTNYAGTMKFKAEALQQ